MLNLRSNPGGGPPSLPIAGFFLSSPPLAPLSPLSVDIICKMRYVLLQLSTLCDGKFIAFNVLSLIF